MTLLADRHMRPIGAFAPGIPAWAGSEVALPVNVRPHAAARSVGKRAFDVSVALLLLMLLAPLLLLLALVIRATSPGPALFKQRRTGLERRVFQIYKFRTMRVMEDGDLVAARRDDDRITPIGAFLRRSSLDELPQLLNVLKGDMSLVGPRPHALAHDRTFATIIHDYDLRFAVRPGLTGLAQVSGFRGEVRGSACLSGRVAADLRYVGTWSFSQDLRILWATALTVWRDEKAY